MKNKVGIDSQGPYRLMRDREIGGKPVWRKRYAFRYTCTRCGTNYWVWPKEQAGLCANCLFSGKEASGEDQEYTA